MERQLDRRVDSFLREAQRRSPQTNITVLVAAQQARAAPGMSAAATIDMSSSRSYTHRHDNRRVVPSSATIAPSSSTLRAHTHLIADQFQSLRVESTNLIEEFENIRQGLKRQNQHQIDSMEEVLIGGEHMTTSTIESLTCNTPMSSIIARVAARGGDSGGCGSNAVDVHNFVYDNSTVSSQITQEYYFPQQNKRRSSQEQRTHQDNNKVATDPEIGRIPMFNHPHPSVNSAESITTTNAVVDEQDAIELPYRPPLHRQADASFRSHPSETARQSLLLYDPYLQLVDQGRNRKARDQDVTETPTTVHAMLSQNTIPTFNTCDSEEASSLPPSSSQLPSDLQEGHSICVSLRTRRMLMLILILLLVVETRLILLCLRRKWKKESG